ncbi:MAG: formylglycine-generating enzyme family protein [Prevotellaceae bacterium]|jgi:formylglycine-generating enzyme required for sulfatase activity|nr:formylglycine-generating enzyme family protein [Prevotellaceae bacterium]
MKQNYKISLCALLLAGAVSTMNAGAQGSGKPTLAGFVVGNMDNTLVSPVAAQLGANLTSGGQYALTSVGTSSKLTELQSAYNAGGGSSIDRSALAEWGRTNGVVTICLVVDDVKGNDHMFSAQLIDAKDSKLSGKGHYIRTGVGSGDLTRVSLTLAKQLEGPERRHVAAAPAHSYPVELDIEMVFVEGGTFTMGCTPDQGSACDPTADVDYPHNVTISSFSIGKYEITQAQWITVMKGHETLANPSRWKDDDQLPVESVSWLDIDTVFLPRLNALTGKNYRLPTEAEWEYAARGCKGDGNGGTATCENLMYSGSNYVDEVGWHAGNSGNCTHIVGQKKPNKLGIYDMSGNVWEWCRDWGSETYYKTSPVNNPENTVPSTPNPSRVMRGGPWLHVAIHARTAVRNATYPYSRLNTNGLRVALPAQ